MPCTHFNRPGQSGFVINRMLRFILSYRSGYKCWSYNGNWRRWHEQRNNYRFWSPIGYRDYPPGTRRLYGSVCDGFHDSLQRFKRTSVRYWIVVSALIRKWFGAHASCIFNEQCGDFYRFTLFECTGECRCRVCFSSERSVFNGYVFKCHLTKRCPGRERILGYKRCYRSGRLFHF